MDRLENHKDLKPSCRECFSESHIQHARWIRDGVDKVLNIFATGFKKYPDFAMEIKRSAADADLVWMHLHNKRSPDVLANAVIKLFPMIDGKFVAHWNGGQAVAAQPASDNTMF